MTTATKKTTSSKSTEQAIDASTPKGDADRTIAAMNERRALVAWEKGGKKGKRPSTANLDAINAEQKEQGPRSQRPKAKSTGSRGRKSLGGEELRFVVDGRPIIDTHNRLSGVSRSTGFKGGKKLSTDELRVWLGKQGVKNPDSEPFKVTLPNGVVLEARTDTPALKKLAHEPKPKTTPKKSTATTASSTSKSTTKKSAAKRTTAAKKAA